METLEMTLERAGYDALPEAIKPLYAEKDGKYGLKVNGLPDTAKEAEAKKALEDQLALYRALGKKPEEIAELIKSAAEKEGKLTELEKLRQKLDLMEADAKTRNIRELKMKALRDAKYPDEKIESLLHRVQGEDDVTIKANGHDSL